MIKYDDGHTQTEIIIKYEILIQNKWECAFLLRLS